ncbi:hypothetical protein M0804_015334 [Polistes exclamans]|nr:hypothetical protein M0804_015334 [Polistes exclamans]
MVKRFSGPKAYPIIGNLNFLIGDIKGTFVFYIYYMYIFAPILIQLSNNLIKLTTNYPSPQRLWVGPKLMIVLDDPEHMKILSTSSYGYEKNQIYEFFKCELGDGLFSAPALKWSIHRTLLNPIFKEQILTTSMDSILRNSMRLVNNLETTNGKNVDILHYLHLCTLDIVFDGLLGNDLDLQNNSECKLNEYITESMEIVMKRTLQFWLHPDIIFCNSYSGKRLKKLTSRINKITSEIIRKKKASMEVNKVTEELQQLDANEGKNTSIFLDLLFKSFYETGEYSEKDIQDEINTFILAGSDTTSGTLAFVFLMVATFPEVQQQIYEELYQIYGSSDPAEVPITLEDIKEMKYLERVIKETLRLFPPGPFIGRKLSEDKKEKYWKQPLTFNPDRFLQGNYDPKCFIPFSFGKRDCIGQTFAMNEMKIIAATILRKFIVHIDNKISVKDIPIKIGITLKPAVPKLLKFYKR